MAANYLWLKDDKTEFIVLGSRHMLRKVTTSEITIGEHRIPAVMQARNIGAEFDCNMNMEALYRGPGISYILLARSDSI